MHHQRAGACLLSNWRRGMFSQRKTKREQVPCVLQCRVLQITVGAVSMGFLGFVGVARQKHAKGQLDKGMQLLPMGTSDRAESDRAAAVANPSCSLVPSGIMRRQLDAKWQPGIDARTEYNPR